MQLDLDYNNEKVFTNKKDLQQHLVTPCDDENTHPKNCDDGPNSGENQCFLLQCEQCSHAFQNRKNLDQHLRLYHETIRHDCSKCKDSDMEVEKAPLKMVEPTVIHPKCRKAEDNSSHEEDSYKRAKLRFREVFEKRKYNLEWKKEKFEEDVMYNEIKEKL